MTKIRDYNINGIIILGVDAGYGNYKTARCCFPTALKVSDYKPVLAKDYFEYDGKFYILGEGHKSFISEKTDDEDNYILTLVAVAKELRARGISKAKIHLAVGLPLKWVQTQKEEFKRYMMQKRKVSFRYGEVDYEIEIVGCTVLPQCYAAVAENLSEYKGMYMLADIGNGTMNMMILNNGRTSEGKAWTIKMGVYQCFLKIKNRISDKYAVELPDEIIENYLRSGQFEGKDKYLREIKEAVIEYANEIFDKLREHGYNPDIMKLHIIGGGAKVIESAGTFIGENVTFDSDVRLTARGYEYCCYMGLKRSQKA